jgi:uncharacterized OsmC-like protein
VEVEQRKERAMAELEVRRVGNHEFTGHNDRGAEVTLGRAGAEGSFTPAELLQIAVAGCSAVTAEELIARRVGADSAFTVGVDADRRPGSHELDAIHVGFDIDVSGLDDTGRAQLETVVRNALDQLCTVSRTVKHGAPVSVDVLPVAADRAN